MHRTEETTKSKFLIWHLNLLLQQINLRTYHWCCQFDNRIQYGSLITAGGSAQSQVTIPIHISYSLNLTFSHTIPELHSKFTSITISNLACLFVPILAPRTEVFCTTEIKNRQHYAKARQHRQQTRADHPWRLDGAGFATSMIRQRRPTALALAVRCRRNSNVRYTSLGCSLCPSGSSSKFSMGTCAKRPWWFHQSQRPDDRGNYKKIKLFDDPLISHAILHHQNNPCWWPSIPCQSADQATNLISSFSILSLFRPHCTEAPKSLQGFCWNNVSKFSAPLPNSGSGASHLFTNKISLFHLSSFLECMMKQD